MAPPADDPPLSSLFRDPTVDVTVVQLQHARCSICGRPATAAVRELDTKKSLFFCEGCRPGPR